MKSLWLCVRWVMDNVVNENVIICVGTEMSRYFFTGHICAMYDKIKPARVREK